MSWLRNILLDPDSEAGAAVADEETDVGTPVESESVAEEAQASDYEIEEEEIGNLAIDDDGTSQGEGEDKTKPAEATDSDKTEAATADDRDANVSGSFDPELVSIAKQAGFTDQLINSFENQAQLDAAVNEQVAGMQTAEQRAQTKPDQQADEIPKLKPFELNLDTDYLDEKSVDQLKAMNKHYQGAFDQLAGENEKLEGAIRSIASHIGKQEKARATKELDAWRKDLGEDWDDVFGKDQSFAKLGDKSVERQAFNKVLAAAGALNQQYQKAGLPELDTAEMLSQGLRTAFGDKVDNLAKAGARKEISNKLKTRSKGMRPKSTGKTDETRNEASAIEAVNAYKNAHDSEYDGVEMDAFL